MNIVVTDDEPEIVTILTSWLHQRGDTPCVVNTRSALRKLLLEQKCDVVLLDLVMPWANGLSLIEDIRNRSPKTAVLIISALADARVVVTASKEGADAYLVKPIDFEKLDSMLNLTSERQASESSGSQSWRQR